MDTKILRTYQIPIRVEFATRYRRYRRYLLLASSLRLRAPLLCLSETTVFPSPLQLALKMKTSPRDRASPAASSPERSSKRARLDSLGERKLSAGARWMVEMLERMLEQYRVSLARDHHGGVD